MRLCTLPIAVLSLLTFSTTSAQVLLASNTTFPIARTNAKAPGTPNKESAEKIIPSGTITTPAGVLPGAVVILSGTKQMAVTNADGEFQFVVPVNAGPLLARVTYAGYADENMTLNASAAESMVTLANARVIVAARKQRLKAYTKTAQKEVKRSLKQAHKKKPYPARTHYRIGGPLTQLQQKGPFYLKRPFLLELWKRRKHRLKQGRLELEPY